MAVMVVLFVSSSMTYHQQSIKSDLHEIWPPLTKFLSSLKFSYAGKMHSVAIDGYGDFVEFILRKLAHFGSFFILGGSLLYGLKSTVKNKFWLFFLTFFSAAGIAAFDEFHQALTGDRTPSFNDVMLDTCGAVTGMILIVLCLGLVQLIKQAKTK